MANYYTEFSFVVKLPSNMISWSQELLKAVCTLVEQYDDHGEILERPDDCPVEFFEQAKDLITSWENAPYFCATPQDDGLWFHVEESGSPSQVADFLLIILQHFNSDDIVAFSWSDVCSKPRLDAFGGGAMVVTKDDVQFECTEHWMAQTVEKIHALREPCPQRDYRQSSGSRCPYCQSDDLTGSSMQTDADTAWQTITCEKCDSHWDDVYTFSHFDDFVATEQKNRNVS